VKKLKELTLEQLLDIQGEHFADNFESGKQDDAYSNHVNRHVVWAMERQHGQVFLGVFSPLCSDMPLFRPWEGESVAAFSADFAVPTLDEELIRLVEDYNANRADLDPTRLFAITDRIDQIGGALLHWFGEDQAENN
jgi:hypothetical protein